jgi:FkbM family methyltransferase
MQLLGPLLKTLITGSQKHYTKLLNKVLKKKTHALLAHINKHICPLQHVFDIGAHRGAWSVELNSVLKKSNFYLFEANPLFEPSLSSTGFPYFLSVLSDRETTVDFYFKNGTGDSYFKENTEHYRDVVPTPTATTTLDALVLKEKLPYPNLLKLDTQGSEIDILRGARNVIENVSIIYVECPIQPYNLASPEIADYLDFFRAIDFVPLELGEVHYFNNALIQVDLLLAARRVHERLIKRNS